MTTSITTISNGQLKQVKRFAEDVIDRVLSDGSIDKEGVQKLIENGDAFQEDIATSLRKLSQNNQYADEETESEYGYLSGYGEPKPLKEQIASLKKLFSGVVLGSANLELVDQPSHQSSEEGFFAIPDWKLVAPTYPEAVQKVLDLIKESRNGDFYNYRDGQIDVKHLRQSKKTERAWAIICESQKEHGTKIIRAQFGIHHRGKSVRRALETMNSKEFGLGVYEIGIMLLTHPERLQHYDDLWIDCAGDEFSNDGDGAGGFDDAPYFRFNGDGVLFGTRWIDDVCDSYGSASAFLPK